MRKYIVIWDNEFAGSVYYEIKQDRFLPDYLLEIYKSELSGPFSESLVEKQNSISIEIINHYLKEDYVWNVSNFNEEEIKSLKDQILKNQAKLREQERKRKILI